MHNMSIDDRTIRQPLLLETEYTSASLQLSCEGYWNRESHLRLVIRFMLFLHLTGFAICFDNYIVVRRTSFNRSPL